MVILALVCLAGYICYMTVPVTLNLKAAIKAVPGFACLLYALCDNGSPLLCAGIGACALADMVIEHRFLPGTALFALAHAFLIAGFPALHSFALPQLLLFLSLSALFVILILHGKNIKVRLPVLLYALLLSFMVSVSAFSGLLFAIAGSLFALSDLLLGLRILYHVRFRGRDWLCMGLYYTSLFLMAAAACA